MILTRSPCKDLCKIMQGARREDFTRISKDLLKRICARSYKAWARIPPGSPQDLRAGTCTRSCTDLLERTSPEPVQDLRKRLCARSCTDLGPLRGFQQDLHKIFSQGFVQDQAGASQRISAGSAQHLVRRTCAREGLTRISTRPLRWFHQDHFVRACAVEMHMDTISCTNLQVREGFQV